MLHEVQQMKPMFNKHCQVPIIILNHFYVGYTSNGSGNETHILSAFPYSNQTLRGSTEANRKMEKFMFIYQNKKPHMLQQDELLLSELQAWKLRNLRDLPDRFK